jgi:hypothetical protein
VKHPGDDVEALRRGERLTDPPEPASSGRRIAIGCAIASLAAILLAGAVGLVIAGWSRFAAPAIAGRDLDDDEEGDDRDEGQGTTIAPDGDRAAGAGTEPPRSEAEALAEMRRRYVAGPHVRIEGMIPSPHPPGAAGAVRPWQQGRSADTPWMVLGARFEPGAPPGSSSQPAPRAGHAPGERADQPLTILAGVPAEARVRAADASGGASVTSYAIAFPGYRGHFVLPATVPTELGLVSAGGSDGAMIRFSIGAPIRPDGSIATSGDPFPATISIAAIDAGGRISPYVSRPLSILPVGTGDVEVALTMSEATDLDLYVTDPTGTTVYFGNTTGVSSGQLDLDANAGCGSNLGVDNEHVFWERGRAPRGTYTVRVAHYASCIEGRPVDYRVTVRNCGETAVLTGRFVGRGQSETCLVGGQDPSWCQDVVSFVVPPCGATN